MSHLDYHSAQFSENLAIGILHSCGVSCELNNIEDKTAVDICTNTGVKIDVQFSNNFARYGDFRLDIVSVYTPKNAVADRTYIFDSNLNIIKNFEQKYHCNVSKVGKILQKNYLDYFIILFYNEKFLEQDPDYMLLISKSDLVAYIKPNVGHFFHRIIINNKQVNFNEIGLQDEHGSAFIPIKVSDLVQCTNCIFGAPDEFISRGQQVRTYLGL